MPEKIILDCDPGVDDALAILLALNSPEVELLGITTVAGNVNVEKTSRNTLRILNFVNRLDIPVYRGMHKPIINELSTAEFVHGDDGLGDVNIPDPKNKSVEKEHAVNYIIKIVEEYKNDLTIVATGPLTNIAMAILLDPTIPKKIRKIVSMGGAFQVTPYGYGNATPLAEFNIYTDPEAAKIVYESGAEIYAVGLDVTMNPNAVVTREERERIRDEGGRLGKLFYEMTKRLSELTNEIALHDPLALSYIIDPEILKFRKYPVRVELRGELSRGATIVDRREWLPEYLREKAYEVYIAYSVDGERFLKLMWDRVFSR